MSNHEVRFVYWNKDDRVTDIMAVTVEEMKEGKTPKLLRAIEQLDRMRKNVRPESYARITIELVEYVKENGEYDKLQTIRVDY